MIYHVSSEKFNTTLLTTDSQRLNIVKDYEITHYAATYLKFRILEKHIQINLSCDQLRGAPSMADDSKCSRMDFAYR